MAQREPSAAQALFGHLPSAARPEVEQRRKPTTGQSMHPGQPSLMPKAERRLSPDELREAWHEHLWALVGIRRKR